jgi:FkbM family methyltransferase
LKGGVTVRIGSRADWHVFNEVFTEGDYDIALIDAFAASKPPALLTVLDLGANVGFFALRVLNMRHTISPQSRLQMICIEGCEGTFNELQNRVGRFEEIKLVHGLVGEKEGEARIVESPYHAMANVGPVGSKKGQLTRYVNLDELTRDWPVIDVLKCDIEGAEERFIERYPELLRKTSRVIVELHSFGSDVQHCVDLLESYGLKRRSTVMSREWISLQYFSRDSG